MVKVGTNTGIAIVSRAICGSFINHLSSLLTAFLYMKYDPIYKILILMLLIRNPLIPIKIGLLA
jgi:hypothetical protein